MNSWQQNFTQLQQKKKLSSLTPQKNKKKLRILSVCKEEVYFLIKKSLYIKLKGIMKPLLQPQLYVKVMVLESIWKVPRKAKSQAIHWTCSLVPIVDIIHYQQTYLLCFLLFVVERWGCGVGGGVICFSNIEYKHMII